MRGFNRTLTSSKVIVCEMTKWQPHIPSHLLDQMRDKASEGLALAKADPTDGAIMEFQWCNAAFSKIIGYTPYEVVGQRGTILIGADVEQEKHLLIIENLMNWQRFSVVVRNNRKCGEAVVQQINWTPMSDARTESRWWLCSLFELEDQPQDVVKVQLLDAPDVDWEEVQSLKQTVRYLEKENLRLHALARVVARESNEDSLTRLSNRRHFEVESKAWIAALRSEGIAFAVLYVDLDDFKLVNDTLGHEAGDMRLISVAEKLRQLCAKDDFIARLGGDEFVVLKRLGDSALNISGLADDIVREMQVPFSFDGKFTSCSASVGVAIANARMQKPERVVADADCALYHAKAQGKKRWSFFTEEMHAHSIATKRLASDLLIACENREFIPYFQPLVDAKTGQIASAEVLVRWPHPQRGLLQPAEFLDTAADIGILKTVDSIIFSYLRETLDDLDRAGVVLPRVAVNVSAGRLADPTFIHDIKTSGIQPDRIIVEILESVYLERISDVVRWTLDELNDLGVTVAIDDFGTGHASVQGLLKIKPSVLKIDRQFIQPMVKDGTSRALVASIIGIGKSLGVKIVAEGVETEQHARIATEMGCDFLQGFYFGRPMSTADLSDTLGQNAGEFWCPKPCGTDRST